MTKQEYQKQYYENNKERNKEKKKLADKIYGAKYRKEKKKFIAEKRKGKEKEATERAKKWRKDNPEKIKQLQKKYRDTEKVKEYHKQYKNKNKDRINEKRRIRDKERRKSDILYGLKKNLRSRIYYFLKRKGLNKAGSTEQLIGCSYEYFKTHLESKFLPWMNWDNYGLYNGELNYGWDIDHIKPLSMATDNDSVLLLTHYTNLQPLCTKVNREIKKDNF